MCFRKVLQRIVEDLAPEVGKTIDPKKKGDLYRAIVDVLDRPRIEADLKAWAIDLKDRGNAAAHDEFTIEECEELHRLTELLLTYLYTLPTTLKERRG